VSLLANIAEKTDLEVAEALGEPFRMGLIKEDASIDHEPEYRFTNDTVKSYLHDLLPRPMTTIFHTKMAAFFEGLYVEGREDTVAATAYHYCHGADPAKAREYSLLAAKSAERRKANKETIRWLESYLSLSDSNGDGNGGLFEALRLLGELYSLTGDGLKAEATLKRALGLAVSDEDKASVLSRLGTNAQTLSMFSEARSRYGEALHLSEDPVIKVNILLSMVYLDDAQGRQTHALPRLEQARELLETAPENTKGLENARAEYFKRLGDIVSEVKPGTKALEHYEEARARFHRLGDTVGEASTINNMSTEYSIIGDYEKSLDLLRQAERLNTRLDDALGLTIALYNLAETYGCLSQISMARDYYHRYLALSKRIKNRLGDGYGQLGLGYLNELEGDLAAAEQRYREAAVTFDELDAHGVALVSFLRLVEVLLASGKLQEAEEVLARLQEGNLGELGPDIESDLLFMSGLVCFVGAREGKPGQAAEAERLLRRSLAVTKTIDLHPLMKRYYYLVLTLHIQGASNEYRNTLKEAVDLLNERLSFIKTSTIRAGILQIREISHLLSEARECSITQ